MNQCLINKYINTRVQCASATNSIKKIQWTAIITISVVLGLNNNKQQQQQPTTTGSGHHHPFCAILTQWNCGHQEYSNRNSINRLKSARGIRRHLSSSVHPSVHAVPWSCGDRTNKTRNQVKRPQKSSEQWMKIEKNLLANEFNVSPRLITAPLSHSTPAPGAPPGWVCCHSYGASWLCGTAISLIVIEDSRHRIIEAPYFPPS